jgi:hypothetical protein
MKTIKFINNNGGGFARDMEIGDHVSISVFCYENSGIEDFRSEDWTIRVNRSSVTPEYVLQDGDRVTITPVSIKGA